MGNYIGFLEEVYAIECARALIHKIHGIRRHLEVEYDSQFNSH